MRVHTYSQGLSLVETMVALAVFSLVSVTGYQAFLQMQQIVDKKAFEHQALWIAEEGLRAAYAIARDDFSALTAGTWGIDGSSGVWELAGSSDMIDIFSRSVTFSEIDADTKTIDSEVTWDYKNEPHTTVLSTRVTNWQQAVSSETDELTIDVADAYINQESLYNVLLSATDEPLTITHIQTTWDKNARTLLEIQSPVGVSVFGPGSASSGANVAVSGLVVPALADREVVFVFDKNMNNTEFTITFTLGDGSSQTVNLTGL